MSVTLSSMTPTFVKAVFTGLNGSGTVSIPGVKAGDIIFTPSNWLGSFENTPLAADDQIQQYSASDLSAITITLYLLRWA